MIAMIEQIHWSHSIGINLPHHRDFERVAEKTWKEFVNRLSRMLKAKPERMLWFATFEHGPSGSNPHLHALIGGPSRALNEHEMQASCVSIKQAMQVPRIMAEGFENGPNAISYLFKERESSLDDDRWPMPSPNIPETLRRRRRM